MRMESSTTAEQYQPQEELHQHNKVRLSEFNSILIVLQLVEQSLCMIIEHLNVPSAPNDIPVRFSLQNVLVMRCASAFGIVLKLDATLCPMCATTYSTKSMWFSHLFNAGHVLQHTNIPRIYVSQM